jgi:hypothetical protein
MSGRWVSLRRSRERERRRIFGNGRRTLAATPAPKRETRFGPPSWRALPLPPLLEGVAENVALAPISACSRIWSVPVPPSLRRQAHGRSRLGRFPREDKATAMRVLSLSGKPSASRSGRAVSTLIRKVPGLRRHLPGGFVREAAMANAGPLVETRRCISPHVFAAVMAHSRRLFSAVRPWRCRCRAHKDREKHIRANTYPRS